MTPLITDVHGLIDCRDFSFYVDGHEMCKVGTFVATFKVYPSKFYVFNIEFSKTLENSMMFFERVVIKKSDMGKRGKRALSLWEKLEMGQLGKVREKRELKIPKRIEYM